MGSWDEIFIELLGSPGAQSHVYTPPADKEVCSPFLGCILDANQTFAELQHPGSQNSQLPCVYMKQGYLSILCYSTQMPF